MPAPSRHAAPSEVVVNATGRRVGEGDARPHSRACGRGARASQGCGRVGRFPSVRHLGCRSTVSKDRGAGALQAGLAVVSVVGASEHVGERRWGRGVQRILTNYKRSVSARGVEWDSMTIVQNAAAKADYFLTSQHKCDLLPTEETDQHQLLAIAAASNFGLRWSLTRAPPIGGARVNDKRTHQGRVPRGAAPIMGVHRGVPGPMPSWCDAASGASRCRSNPTAIYSPAVAACVCHDAADGRLALCQRGAGAAACYRAMHFPQSAGVVGPWTSGSVVKPPPS